jgi:hypothetical protein
MRVHQVLHARSATARRQSSGTTSRRPVVRIGSARYTCYLACRHAITLPKVRLRIASRQDQYAEHLPLRAGSFTGSASSTLRITRATTMAILAGSISSISPARPCRNRLRRVIRQGGHAVECPIFWGPSLPRGGGGHVSSICNLYVDLQI